MYLLPVCKRSLTHIGIEGLSCLNLSMVLLSRTLSGRGIISLIAPVNYDLYIKIPRCSLRELLCVFGVIREGKHCANPESNYSFTCLQPGALSGNISTGTARPGCFVRPSSSYYEALLKLLIEHYFHLWIWIFCMIHSDFCYQKQLTKLFKPGANFCTNSCKSRITCDVHMLCLLYRLYAVLKAWALQVNKLTYTYTDVCQHCLRLAADKISFARSAL